MTSVKSENEMRQIGQRLGRSMRGGEVVELVGDVGAGKTTLTKGIGLGLAVDDDVQSPSFTISRIYEARQGLELHHYDFYRLQDAGIMSHELAESMARSNIITVIEWAETVGAVLPDERLIARIKYSPDGESREITFDRPDTYSYLEVS